MKRIQLTIAYDGTNYCGWQIQPNGITIEQVLAKKLSELLQEQVQVIGASRTDSGVHAMGNIAVFDTNTKIPADKICLALNQRLPDDITIQDSREVSLNFHPRKCNSVKTYEYKILNRKFRLPSWRLNSYFFYMPLDFEKMKEAAKYLVGEHDFKSFCSIRTKVEDMVRIIYSLELSKQEDMITIRISGNGFLYNMVRIIVGTLIKVGLGVYSPSHMEEILEARDREAAGPKAPANGLTLIGLEFEQQLPKYYHGQNKYWDYDAFYGQIGSRGKSYLVIYRCEDQFFEELVSRTVNQSLRNGANEVFISDQKDRIRNESKLGPYTFCESYDRDLLESDRNEWNCKAELIDKKSMDHLYDELGFQRTETWYKWYSTKDYYQKQGIKP